MLTLVLRFLHVVGGALWVGGVSILAFFIFPAIRASGPAGGAVMRQVAGVRKLPEFLAILGWVTVLSGITLYIRDTMGGANGWGGTPMGITFAVGGTIALVALLVGTFYNRPLAAKMTALGAQLQGAGTPPPADLVAEMARLQDAFQKASWAVSIALIAAVMAMSIARYV